MEKPCNRLCNHDDVKCLRERGVLRTRSAHVDNPLLKADNLPGCDHSHTLKHVSYAAADHVHFAYEPRKYAAAAFYFHARLNDVFHRHNTGSLIGLGDVNINGSQALIFESVNHLLLVNIQNVALYFCLSAKTHVFDRDVA